MKKYFLLLILCSLSIISFGQIEESQAIDSIFTEWNKADAPGCALGIIKDGKLIYAKGYGMANLEYEIPITPTTIFDIASLSKQFTGFAVAKLLEQKQISLDDDIRQYIPELPDFGHTITIDHLLHHTSGIRDWPGTLALAGLRMDDVLSYDRILTMAFNQKELNFKPGSEYSYSNTGYNLLAELVQRVTGESFRKWTDNNIFKPLEMSNTHFHDDHTEIIKNKANGYYFDDDGKFHAAPNSLTAIGSSSLYTTIDDLAKWVKNMDNPIVGGKSVIDLMFQQGILNNGDQISYAFGLSIDKYHGLKRISHSGSWASFSTYLAYFPESQLSIIVLFNTPANSFRIAHDIADIYLEEYYTDSEIIKSETQVYKNLKVKQLEKFTADYWNEAGSYSRKIYVKNDTLRYFRGEGNESSLMPISNNEFQMLNVGVNLKVKFENKDKIPVMVVTIDEGDPIISEQYIPASYSKEQLIQFTGTFYSEELSTSYTIELHEDKLVAKHMRGSNIEFKPVKEDLFTGNQWYFSTIKFDRDDTHKIKGLLVSSGRVRNLLFKKVN